ncbi:MAG: hypothetical protein RQ801_14120 [Spirochaetaceae bacterium]|nr:hypothetical protein [Spirochaetaceae bacterium]MDT8299438.1 hypothetical protein [Spirochaetaceae bacterium]
MGSDFVVVGGIVAEDFVPKVIEDDDTLNKFGMEMKPTPLFMEVVKCPLASASSVDNIEACPFPDPAAPGLIHQGRILDDIPAPLSDRNQGRLARA